jgi:hypothetical protein
VLEWLGESVLPFPENHTMKMAVDISVDRVRKAIDGVPQ